MPYQPAGLSETLDAWHAQVDDGERYEAVVLWMQDMLQAPEDVEDAQPVPGMVLPTFSAVVPETAVAIVWVVIEQFSTVKIAQLHDFKAGKVWGAGWKPPRL